MKKALARSKTAQTRLWPTFACAGLCAFLALFYWPSLRYPPISLDDLRGLKQTATLPFWRIWGSDPFGHFRPVKTLLFWLVSHATEGPWGWRAAILCAFLTSAVTVQTLAVRVTGSLWLGVAVAVCWSLNPTTPSVVCWLSAANLIVCLVGVTVYLRVGDRALEENSAPPRVRPRVAVALVSLIVALLSHESALAAPVVLFAFRRICLQKSAWQIKHPVYLGSASCIAGYLGLRLVSAGPAAIYRIEQEPAWLLSVNAARYLSQNALLWLWPFGRFGVLLVDQPATHLLASIVCWLVLITAGILVWRFRHLDPPIVFGLVWFTLFLAPACNFIPFGNTPVAVHYLFLPGVGLAIVVCRAVVLAVRYVYIKNERLRAAVSAAMVASLCILWLPETGKVISAWGDEERLFLITHANYPRNIEALVNLSSVYLNRHKFERAKVFVEKARQIAPENLGAIMNAFALFSGSGQLTAALELMDRHPQLGGRAEVWVRRGEIMERLERFDEAVAAFQRAFDITFGTAQSETRYIAGYRLVVALLRTGERRQAEDLVDRLLLEYPHRKELLTVRRLLSNGDISGGPLRTQ